jgi:hypothetical protein
MQKIKGFAEVNGLPVREAAKVYIQCGIAVVPDKPKSKQPAIVNWLNAGTSATAKRTAGGRAE